MNRKTDRFEWLLNKRMAGTASGSEKAELEQLIDEDERKRLVYTACMEGTPEDRRRTEMAFERHWDLLHKRGDAVDTKVPVRNGVWRKVFWQVGAAAAVLFFLGWLVWQAGYPGEASQFMTEYGQRKKIVLPDGSTVWLNGGSKLTYDKGFNDNNRKVTLRGEGYFDVKKDEAHPFVIDVGGATVNVLGTVFNLRAYEEEELVETSLIEGKIALTLESAEAPIILTPGKKLSVYKNKNRMPEIPDQLELFPLENSEVAVLTDAKTAEGETNVNDALWKDNKLVFDGDHLDMIASKLQKWYGVQVAIADTTLKALKFSGVFQDMSVDEVLQTLAQTGGVRYRIDENGVTFIPVVD